MANMGAAVFVADNTSMCRFGYGSKICLHSESDEFPGRNLYVV